ncbi:MAG: prepilin-type N-terminal cleavage/methylation domain-containing protein [Pedosphaera sp.]|nr:prepilin-type N-terminal cleavage/methylation domain-containing protein [Pedosphaera sp.]
MNVAISNRKPAPAFTLLEVLIATVAFAIVLAAVNAVFYGALRLRNKSAQSIDDALPLQRTVTTIKRDLANLVLPGGTMQGALQTTSVTNSIMGQVSPEFCTSNGIVDETTPWADIQKVSYALIPSADRTARGLVFVRAVNRNLLPPDVATTPIPEWLMSGVQAVVFSYYDGLQWRTYWDSTTADTSTGETNAVPQAIKVQIQLAPGENDTALTLSAPVEIVVPILVQTATSQTTGATR